MDSFSFHYVKTPTGEISGASFMQQTEDVINDLGKFATESKQDSTEALRIAKEAMSTADTANANAATALSTANSAISIAKSLQIVVDGWEPKLEQAVADASQAVKTAQAAEANSTQALGTANAAKSTSDQAIVTANSALAASNTATTVSIEARDTANSAIEIARQAVVDVSDDVALMKGLVATATERAENASISAGVAQSAAAQAQGYAKVAAFAVRLTSANMSASGTAALSSLTPQTNIKVGDTVIDPDGKVFQIASLASSTFTVGEEFTSIQGPRGEKGDVGINYTTTATDDVTAGTTALETGHFIFIYEN